MERSLMTPNRRSILRLFYRFNSSHLTDRYGLAASPQCNRNCSRLSKSASRTSYSTQVTKRSFHNTRLNNNTTATRNTTKAHQAYPLSGYYSDLLSFHQPSHQQRTPTTNNSNPSPPEPNKEPTKEQKLAIVFGTRLAGPGYQSTRYNPETMPPESTWKQINGVPIPPRPTEPDNCCMSGCVHCVWDDYRDDLEHWASRVRDARITANAAGSPEDVTGKRGKEMRQTPRKEVASASTSMDDDGGGSETNWELPSSLGGADEEDLFKGIPVGIREFMKIEKKLREKKMQQ